MLVQYFICFLLQMYMYMCLYKCTCWLFGYVGCVSGGNGAALYYVHVHEYIYFHQYNVFLSSS